MNHFNRTQEFEREHKKLLKRFRSLEEDIVFLEDVLVKFPTGKGSKFVILHNESDCVIVKTRIMCRTLRNSSLRIIYAWRKSSATFTYLEIYFKGDKENENRERIKEYLRKHI